MLNYPVCPSLNDLPKFSIFEPDFIEKSTEDILVNNRLCIAELIDKTAKYTWENLLTPIELLEARLNYILYVTSLLCDTTGCPKLLKSFHKIVALIIEYRILLLHDYAIFNAYNILSKDKKINLTQKKILHNYLKNAKMSGIDLDAMQRDELQKIVLRLTELGDTFDQNVAASMNAWSLHITDPKQLSGIPKKNIEFMRQESLNQGISGWIIKLDDTTYSVLMKHADDSNLRWQIHVAYSTLASSYSDKNHNNDAIIIESLQLRSKVANLLGYKTYADYSLCDNSLNTTNAVYEFLHALINKDKAILEMSELQEFAHKKGHNELFPWDVAYFSNQFFHHKYGFDLETSEIQFSINNVLSCLFGLATRLFKIEINEIHPFDSWHTDVRLFEIYDHDRSLRGRFYIDLYSRTGKKAGAWCADLTLRFQNTMGHQLPTACIVTNFCKSKSDETPELSHTDMVTLFHEFGHCLQKTLTTVDYSMVAGDSALPLDVTEVVSQFMEHWCYEPIILQQMIQLNETTEMSYDRILKIKHFKTFQIELRTIQDVMKSLLDLHLHTQDILNSEKIQSIYNTIKKELSILPYSDYDHLPNRFSHIFTGGFAAGYYSYLYSAKMADEIFHIFEENGLLCEQTGLQFLSTFLEQSGIKDAKDLLAEFKSNSSIHKKINC